MPPFKSDDLTVIMWPTFTEAQVSFLEKYFPPRCIGKHDKLEDHLRYAGQVELVEMLRAHTLGGPIGLVLTEDEEEALDEMAVGLALEQKQQQQE